MITFGVAMFVLMGRSYQYHDIADVEAEPSNRGGAGHLLSQETVDDLVDKYKQNFGSVWRCFEYLLYATVGNFETDVSPHSSKHMSNLTRWYGTVGLPSVRGQHSFGVDHGLLFFLCAISSHHLVEPPSLCSEQYVRPGDDARGGRVY